EPSIGAAFVNFGGNRNGFLHASDVIPAYGDPSVSQVDILTGKVRSGLDEGPDSVRSALDDSDDEEVEGEGELEAEEEIEGELETQDQEEEAKPSSRKSGRKRSSKKGRSRSKARPRGEVESSTSPDSEEGDSGGEEPRGGAETSEVPEVQETSGNPEASEQLDVSERTEALEISEEDSVVDAKLPMVLPGEEGAEVSDLGVVDSRKKSKRRGRRSPRSQSRGARGGGRGSKRGGRGGGGGEGRNGRGNGGRPRKPIQELLKKGQEVIVQITKEGIGAKGPTLTTYLSLPGRCLVLMPSLPKCGVSRKILDPRERRRLKRIVHNLDDVGSGGIGFIVRTAGINKSGADLERDLEYLKRLWAVIVERAKVTTAPTPLYIESDLVLRTIRDFFSPDIDEVVIDNEEVFERVKDFVEKLMPKFVDRVKHHPGNSPLFLTYGIERAVEDLYKPQVDLPNGATIVIEQTEALVAIDVNSGKFKPGSNLEETAYRTNLDAIPEIVRQLRLRDLGGVIIIDFIDMVNERHRREVERKFRDALKGDRARINVGRISIFGMLELTRQRVGPGLKRTVFKVCPTCKGTSLIRTVQSKALAVLREIRALAQLPGFTRLEAYLHPEVCAFLENRKRRSLVETEDQCNRSILTRAESSYPVDVVHYRFLDERGQEVKVNIPAGLGVHA
ncbi:MAG TPA: Rne/Rng family ribonuclease, partial [Planctomycetes bacterium]|nr:Rne/Rng family ribonuclease [Planctomycetota bacterium]